MGEQPLVKTVANVFREICYANRDQMTAGIICAGWDKREGGQVLLINPLSPNINMHILLSVLHTFLMVLVGRICINIKTFYVW